MTKGGIPLNKTKFGLNATHLRILALTLMLLDHMWATVIPGNNWMTYVGRMAFPIFAFQTAQGYLHTHDFKAYCKRLLIFAAVSEIPFNLMMMSSPIFPFHQNVMLTLLLGLLACRAWDQRKWWKLALIDLDIIVGVGCVYWLYFIFRKVVLNRRKKRAAIPEEATPAEAENEQKGGAEA
jgi:hypothetical protein